MSSVGVFFVFIIERQNIEDVFSHFLQTILYSADHFSAPYNSGPADGKGIKVAVRAKENITLRYVISPKYRPISFVEDEKPNGIILEYLKMLEDSLGLKMELVNVHWPEGLKRTRQKQADLFPCIACTPERGQNLP